MKILFNYFSEARESLERSDENFEGIINAAIDRLLGKETEDTRWYRSDAWGYLTHGLGIERY